MMKARIVKIVSKDYTLQLEDGTRVVASMMGKVRRQDRPVTGDLVEAEETDGVYAVSKILPRHSRLIRPAVANVDQALIVMSVKDPDFSTALIDRLSVLIRYADVTPVLIVTKCDLGIPPETEAAIREYEAGQIPVLRTAKDTLDPDLAGILKGKISVLTGQSGAGKSTLLNTLDPTFRLATQEISKALGRGKHTTRHNELHEVAGGLVADTPGFSSIDFTGITKYELASLIPDFVPYLGSCRFNDCIHQNEPGCGIKQAVEEGKISRTRYINYLQILQIILDRKEKYI